jgi:hypothetical protein
MFILQQAAAPASRYQAVRGALYTARPLTGEQWGLLTRCDGRATRLPAGEVMAALDFLRAHGLVRVVGV